MTKLNEFTFSLKTEIIFGKGKVSELSAILQDNGYKNVMILHGYSAEKTELLQKIEKQLIRNSIIYSKYNAGGGTNPTLLLVNRVSEYINYFERKPDLILAVGGGSIIDTAKAVSIQRESSSVWEYFEGKRKVSEAIPIGVVLTNPASGSECSASTVILNESIHVKRGCSSNLLVPKFAILDPETLLTLSKRQISCAVADIIMHTIERFLCSQGDNNITDDMAIALLKRTILCGEALSDEPNIDVLSELMWCGSISNCGLTGLGSKNEFPLHQIGHQISAFYSTIHAESLTSIWNSWASYYYRKNTCRFAILGRELFDCTDEDIYRCAFFFIDGLTDFFNNIGMPICLNRIITDGGISLLANSITNNGKRIVGEFWRMTTIDIIKILEQSIG